VKPGELVLDPFMGTGATLVAAVELGVEAVGIKIDPAYCAAARRRLGQDALTARGRQPEAAESSALAAEP
jgi:DNA modification methylase